MKNLMKSLTAVILAIALTTATNTVLAQSRRSSGGSTTSSTATTSRSSSSASAARSTSSSRSSAVSSGSQTRSTSSGTVSRSSSSGSATRSTGSSTVSRSTSGTTSRSTSAATTTPQSRSTSGTTTSRSTSGTSATRSTSGTSASSVNRTTRPATGSSTTTATGTQSRSTSSGTVSRSTTSTTGRVATPVRSSGTGTASATRSNTTTRVTPSRSNANVSTKGLGNVGAGERDSRANVNMRNTSYRIDAGRNIQRIPPRERDFMAVERLHSFYSPHRHYFGYRVEILPHYELMHRWGRDFYFYNGIYYRPWGGHYVVCRPPFGVLFDWAVADAVHTAIRFAYYNNVYRTYDIIDDNYATIQEQNRIIAQNNAKIASQNSAIALNAASASTAYDVAKALGLVQSYADASVEYYYEDGVFYTMDTSGRYITIVPPAGALVTELPDDYDTITLGGVDYYKVDDTVYRLTLVDGTPYLEVLGQLTGTLAAKYDSYR